MNNTDANFSYLSGDQDWPKFRREGLEIRDDGALQLYSLPLLVGESPAQLGTMAKPDGPSGIAVDSDGTIYFSDQSTHRVYRIGG